MKMRSRWTYAGRMSSLAFNIMMSGLTIGITCINKEVKKRDRADRRYLRLRKLLTKIAFIAYDDGFRAGVQAEKDKQTEAMVREMAIRDAHYTNVDGGPF